MKPKNTVVLSMLLVLPLLLQAQVTPNGFPTLVLGQPPEVSAIDLVSLGPNVVESRDLFAPSGIAVDPTSGTVYVSDTGNNRVLAWRDGVTFQNGAPADLIIGQSTEYANSANGGVLGTQVGLNAPTGLAVNAQGDLFVADSGNNRVVKYERPFDQVTELKLIKQVIGQPNKMNTSAGVAADRLDLTSGSSPFRAGIAFDAAGNLWVADSDNSRVLRFSASKVGSSGTDGPDADFQLGQESLTDGGDLGLSGPNRLIRDRMRFPSGIAFDAGGRLYVADNLNRVLVYAPAPQIIPRQPANRIMGIGDGAAIVEAKSLGTISGTWNPPEGVFTAGNTIFVVDSGAHRVLRYPPYDQWPPEPTDTVVSPSAQSVLGQPAIEMNPENVLELVNRGRGTSDNDGLASPVAGVFANGKVYIVDTGNNRVNAYPDLTSGDMTGAVIERILGQLDAAFNSPNLVEGQEYFFNDRADIVFDNTVDPPRMYVSDPYNNRILGYNDAYRVRPGDTADLVIGQSDLFRTVRNWPPQVLNPPNDTGLNVPTGLALDSEGNLYVADSGNSRVVRFPKPFEAQRDPSGLLHADLVLGQFDFVSTVTVPTPNTMASPYDVEFTNEGYLLVSDVGHDRILMFQPPFTSGEAAFKVFGQENFGVSGTGSSLSRLNDPMHISVDGDDRLYVADFGNDRILIFQEGITTAPSGATAVLQLTGLTEPRGVWVNRNTDEIWTADSGRQELRRYPNYNTIVATQNSAPNITIRNVPRPISISLDQHGTLFAADRYNRIQIYFPGVAAMVNAADYSNRVAPGMWTSMYLDPNVFGVDQAVTGPFPLPFDLAGLQVLVDSTPAPIYVITPTDFGATQVNLLMPYSMKPSGTREIILIDPSTERILASSFLNSTAASPAFFTANQSGNGQIAAINQKDGTVNSSANPAAEGEFVQLYLNGAGFIGGAPADGVPAPTNGNLIYTPGVLRVYFNGTPMDAADVLFSGLAPGLVGVWQINIRIPSYRNPIGDSNVALQYNSALIVSNVWIATE